MIWLLACAPAPEDTGDTGGPTTAPAFAPTEGAWTVTFGDTWGGDCVLADEATYLGDPWPWELELEGSGVTFYDETGYPFWCALDGQDLACDLGYDTVDYAPSDAVEQERTRLDGAFSSPDAFDATYAISVDCEGGDCAALGTQYGDQFTYPCTAELPVVGVAG